MLHNRHPSQNSTQGSNRSLHQVVHALINVLQADPNVSQLPSDSITSLLRVCLSIVLALTPDMSIHSISPDPNAETTPESQPDAPATSLLGLLGLHILHSLLESRADYFDMVLLLYSQHTRTISDFLPLGLTPIATPEPNLAPAVVRLCYPNPNP